MLVAAGASPRPVNLYGKTALCLACEVCKMPEPVFRLLEARQLELEETLGRALAEAVRLAASDVAEVRLAAIEALRSNAVLRGAVEDGRDRTAALEFNVDDLRDQLVDQGQRLVTLVEATRAQVPHSPAPSALPVSTPNIWGLAHVCSVFGPVSCKLPAFWTGGFDPISLSCTYGCKGCRLQRLTPPPLQAEEEAIISVTAAVDAVKEELEVRAHATQAGNAAELARLRKEQQSCLNSVEELLEQETGYRVLELEAAAAGLGAVVDAQRTELARQGAELDRQAAQLRRQGALMAGLSAQLQAAVLRIETLEAAATASAGEGAAAAPPSVPIALAVAPGEVRAGH